MIGLRSLLAWAAMLLLASSIGSLAVPGFHSFTWKLAAVALVVIFLWLIYPKGKHDE